MKIIKLFVLLALIIPAGFSLATPNLQSTPRPPYGPYLTGQMPLYYFNLLNTGTTDTGTAPPQMNSNWVAVDAYSDGSYPNGKGPDGAWMWISGDAFGPVPAGGSIIVNNGGKAGLPRWPDEDWCVPAGTHRVIAIIDNGNNVPETNNSDNNSVWTSFTVNPRTAPAPDLTATRTPSVLGPYVAGLPATIPFVFSNIGTAVPTALLRARVQIDDFNNGSGMISTYVTGRPVLAVGETRTENFTWPIAIAGTHSARVTYVDDKFQVDELNDCNNTTSWITFTVLPADVQGRITPRTVAGGSVVASTTISVRNVGSITVPQVPYRIIIDGITVAVATSTTPVPVSTTWSNITVPITWTAPNVAATQTVPYVLEVTDPVLGIRSTSTLITISPTAAPIPRLIVCPNPITLIIGSTIDASARYWSNLATAPTCVTAGYTDVTSSAAWSTNSTTVATVTNTGTRGRVTGVNAGATTVVGSYSSLFASTPVTVSVNPITLSLVSGARLIRAGSTASLTPRVTANVNLNCTIQDGVISPINFVHTANVSQISYGPYTSKPLSGKQRIRFSCVNPLDATQRAETYIDIEVIPRTQEV